MPRSGDDFGSIQNGARSGDIISSLPMAKLSKDPTYFRMEYIDDLEAERLSRLYRVVSKLSFWRRRSNNIATDNKEVHKISGPSSPLQKKSGIVNRISVFSAHSPVNARHFSNRKISGGRDGGEQTFMDLNKTFTMDSTMSGAVVNYSVQGLTPGNDGRGEPIVASDASWYLEESIREDEDHILLLSETEIDEGEHGIEAVWRPFRFPPAQEDAHDESDAEAPTEDPKVVSEVSSPCSGEPQINSNIGERPPSTFETADAHSLVTLRDDLSVWFRVREQVKRIFAAKTSPSPEERKQKNQVLLTGQQCLGTSLMNDALSIPVPEKQPTPATQTHEFTATYSSPTLSRVVSSPSGAQNDSRFPGSLHNTTSSIGELRSIAMKLQFTSQSDDEEELQPLQVERTDLSLRQEDEIEPSSQHEDAVEFADLNALKITQSCLTENKSFLSVAMERNCAQLVLLRSHDFSGAFACGDSCFSIDSSDLSSLSCASDARLNDLSLGAIFPFSKEVVCSDDEEETPPPKHVQPLVEKPCRSPVKILTDIPVSNGITTDARVFCHPYQTQVRNLSMRSGSNQEQQYVCETTVPLSQRLDEAERQDEDVETRTTTTITTKDSWMVNDSFLRGAESMPKTGGRETPTGSSLEIPSKRHCSNVESGQISFLNIVHDHLVQPDLLWGEDQRSSGYFCGQPAIVDQQISAAALNHIFEQELVISNHCKDQNNDENYEARQEGQCLDTASFTFDPYDERNYAYAAVESASYDRHHYACYPYGQDSTTLCSKTQKSSPTQ